VHFIGHSAGAKLIHEAATAYIYDYSIRQKNPFVHLTSLDAYTPNGWDNNGDGSYGSLPTDYPNHFSEHYVDRTDSIIGPWTNSCLSRAFNFDITGWPPVSEEEKWWKERDVGHQWPIYWYAESVVIPGFSRYGYPLSF
jgi:hypothetical protein